MPWATNALPSVAEGASQVGLRVMSWGGGRRHPGGPHVLDHRGLIRGRPAGRVGRLTREEAEVEAGTEEGGRL